MALKFNIIKYKRTINPNIIRYQPKTLKSLFLIYPIRNLIAIIETTKATIIPVSNINNSVAEKPNPNFNNFNALAPNITGIDKKNEYSVAI